MKRLLFSSVSVHSQIILKKTKQLTSQHELIGIVRDGEDVWRGLLALLASVGQHHLRVVHRQPLVGVDSDAEETRVGL